jgi:hypothetical protein
MKTKLGINLRFGDIIVNHWAGPKNPHRISIVLSIGKYIRCTDGNGDFWNHCNDHQTRITVIGNCFDITALERCSFPIEESQKITAEYRSTEKL